MVAYFFLGWHPRRGVKLYVMLQLKACLLAYWHVSLLVFAPSGIRAIWPLRLLLMGYVFLVLLSAIAFILVDKPQTVRLSVLGA
jgi:hypothetical protein